MKKELNAMEIQELHITGPNVNLHLTIGANRRWLGASGQNIPSFEVFTSPDWRGTNGWINFDRPVYYAGKRISDVCLVFENGVVTKATASENEDALLEMIKQENADKVGEFSLTDSRHSGITKFMAQTLFDENVGGKYGNTHIALGKSFKQAFAGVPKDFIDWHALGFNQCPKVHTDIVSTSDRKVIAILRNGSHQTIYEHGKFTFIK